MGFLDRERKQLEQQGREHIASLEQTRLNELRHHQAEAERQRQAEEDKKFAPEDNRRLCELLDNLPPLDFGHYVELVSVRTGFNFFMTIGVRGNILGTTADDKLAQRGIPIWWFSDGEFSTPRAGHKRPDNGEPYIELHFSKKVGSRVNPERSNPGTMVNVEDIYNSVTAKLFRPRNAVIIGSGEKKINIVTWKPFDDELEKAFHKPKRETSRYSYRHPEPRQGLA